jgi:hypothetical protein
MGVTTGKSAFQPNIVTNGLVLNLDAINPNSYPQSGTIWYDTSGNNNNGTLTNGTSWTPNGAQTSFSFDGVDDYVNLGTNLPNSFTNCTLETIYKVGAINKSQVLVSSYSNTTGNGWGIEQYASNQFNVFVFNGSNAFVDIQSTIPPVVGQTYSISMVFSSLNKLQMYINGNLHLEKPTTFSSTIKTSPFITRVGNWVANANYFNGNIYNIKMYNQALTAQEVLQNYNALKSRFGLT